ncbi:leucine-rich repeat neuronal protein 4 [Perognathus longimembris pacificus]|uniref:leucine-rich repeat neuronal protein 4 n=1 Tax=Perognathus longimembris pacificus TaxID=214514 RepID=UPI0020198949|nr:leucine-rich repeat neuronal protein 4 [Perognathus longimembris pacificus]
MCHSQHRQLRTLAMQWTLMLLLLLTWLHQSLGRRSQERAPLFRLTQQNPWDSGDSNVTDSPCKGLPTVVTDALTLENRGLEHLPRCLPRTLRSLDGSHNLLRVLSASELGHLPELQVLSLRHNRIAELRWDAEMPAMLHTLDLSSNLLAELPPCAGPALHSLRVLVLAANPLQALRPRAFACFPALRRLNLSSSALGRGDPGGIAEAAFVGAAGEPLATLEVLDLSGTDLERVESGWIRDLPNLTSLYLRKMPRLRILEGGIFKMTPNLQQLDCQDSPALTSVHTHIFQDTPRLQVLLLQNCNLSSFPPWMVNSSERLSVSLFGNPLICSCELSWLFRDTNRTVLSRAADTVCTPARGSESPFPAPVPLSQMPVMCKSSQSTTLLAPTLHPFHSSAYISPTQRLSTEQSPDRSAQPTGQQSVTKPPFHTVAPLTQALWMLKNAGKGISLFTTNSTASYSNGNVPPRAASTAGSERGEYAGSLSLEPGTSSASTPLTSKHLDPFSTPGKPTSTSQPHQTTTSLPHLSTQEVEIPIFLLDDSEEEEGSKEEMRATHQNVLCDYHPCKHLQTPCAELQRRFQCLCPGLSREDTIPDPPKLQGVLEIADSSALIHWCAPNSVVLGYQIHYSAEGKAENHSVVDIYATARQHPLYGLSPATTYHVCVLAANRAGLSPLPASGWRRPCTTFTTRPSSVGIFAGLCATSGLLLVSTLVLSLCLCRQCQTLNRPHSDTPLVAFKNHQFF